MSLNGFGCSKNGIRNDLAYLALFGLFGIMVFWFIDYTKHFRIKSISKKLFLSPKHGASWNRSFRLHGLM